MTPARHGSDAAAPGAGGGDAAPGILVDRDVRRLVGDALAPAPGAPPLLPDQVQPASVDLRLGPRAHRIRAGFQPARVPLEERLRELATETLSLEGDGAVLERGSIHLIPLEEELALPPDVHGRFNPRSSTGRCDLFTRVLVPGHPRFDETPPGWHGQPWLEVAPLSFPVRLRRGDRLSQLRVQRGAAALTDAELRAEYARAPLCFDRAGPLALDRVRLDGEGALELRLGLEGRSPCGWRAARGTGVLTVAAEGAHDARDFWEPVEAVRGQCILEPGRFYIFASRERIRIPPHLAAEMLPVDLGLGELRNNYAGFFDSGFGWRRAPAAVGSGARRAEEPGGTPAVLEVRAHDVPFLVEEGQILFRLKFFRTTGTPERLYAEGRRERSYSEQDLTLARAFRPPAAS